MSKLIDSKVITYERLISRARGFHERFATPYTLASTTLLNVSKTNSGTATIAANATGGNKLTLTTDTNANDEVYAYTNNKMFIMAANQPAIVECQMSWSEANTNKAGVIFGFASATVAGILANTTGVPIATTMSGAFFYKLTGTTNWHSLVSVGTTQVDTDLTKANFFPGYSASGVVPNATSDANEHVYTVELYPQNSTTMEARFFIDGAFMNRVLFAYSGSVAMYAIAGIKGINGTNAEALVISDLFGNQECLPATAIQV